MYYSRVVLLVLLVPFIRALSFSDILVYFGDRNCVLGSLQTLDIDHIEEDEVSSNLISSEIDFVAKLGQDDPDKSAMGSVNELAQYNDIKYEYRLIKEEGPAHSKTFTITLFLGDESYTKDGRSLKWAQRAAATEALKNTNYQHPPIKLKENAKAPTPTSLLNNLAAKLGLSVTYKVVTDDILEALENHSDGIEAEIRPRKSYLEKLNDTVHSNDSIHIRKDGSDPKGPFKVRVVVNGNKFIGESHTIKNAKHEAAYKALKALKDQEEIFSCLKEGDNCKSKKQEIKSPVTLVYESAQQRDLTVKFELIDEVGPSHKKLFTMRCTVGTLEATGQGKSKKESKKVAAENMLPMLLEIPEVKGKSVVQPTSKKSKKNKKNKVVKTTFDKIDRMIDDFVDMGKSFIDKFKGREETDTDSKPPKAKGNKHRMSPSDEILQLGKLVHLNIQYRDYIDNDKSYSVLDLGTKPSFICLGEGVNNKNSRDLAAKHGIDVLYKMGLLDNYLDNSLEIGNILDKEEASPKFHLELIENEKEEL